jgi:hypothetical protein
MASAAMAVLDMRICNTPWYGEPDILAKGTIGYGYSGQKLTARSATVDLAIG